MKARFLLTTLLILGILGVGVHYTLQSLRQSAAPPEPAKTPRLEEAPARVYGLIEPRGREVFVGPLQSRRVVEVLPYVGSRDFRTEDRLERLDTKYVQVILELESPQDPAIGLLVLCERVEIALEKQ